MISRFSLFLLIFIGLLAMRGAFAQNALKAFSTNAYAIDAQTLNGESVVIALWGLESVYARGTPESMHARAALDDLIGDKSIHCAPMGTVVNGTVKAQCLNVQERDLGLMMIGAGFASVNRRDVADSDLKSAYLGAERQARNAQLGVWAQNNNAAVAPPQTAASGFSDMFSGLSAWVIMGAITLLPLLGFLILGLIIHAGFRQLINLQKYQIAGTQKRERQLKEREKYVIAAALEGELNTNRAKLDAFLVIYEELLKSLRDPSKTPKYQRAGDIIHEKPALTRSVYDAHIDKLDLLGPQLSSDLSALYAAIDPSPDYRTLEPEVPIEKAREIVDRILRAAERMNEPMDKVAGALSVIVRDKRGSITE